MQVILEGWRWQMVPVYVLAGLLAALWLPRNGPIAGVSWLPQSGYFVRIPGMFHPNFSDAPLLSPISHWLGITGPIDGKMALNTVNAYTLAFFDQHLKSHSEALLDGPSAQYPEVSFEKRSPEH